MTLNLKSISITATLIGVAVFGSGCGMRTGRSREIEVRSGTIGTRLGQAPFAPTGTSDGVEANGVCLGSACLSSLTLPPIDATLFLDRPEYARIRSRPIKTIDIKGRAIAGTVNHHVLATDLLASFFRSLAKNRPDATRIVILSPDHFNVGRSSISTHSRSYTAPSGIVEVDKEAVQSLVEKQLALEENGSMYELEHGIGALIPFLKDEFPKVSIVPISIRGSADRTIAIKLGKALQALDDGHTLFIVSADMSHYLSKDDALKNDQSIRSWLANRNLQAMADANDDFTDSGLQFVALFTWFNQEKTKPTFIELGHGISSDYNGPDDFTTSYVNGVWVN